MSTTYLTGHGERIEGSSGNRETRGGKGTWETLQRGPWDIEGPRDLSTAARGFEGSRARGFASSRQWQLLLHYWGLGASRPDLH